MEYIDTVNKLMKEISENLDMDLLKFWGLMDKYEGKTISTSDETVETLRQICLKIDKAKRIRSGSIPTFDEAEEIFYEVIQLHPKGSSRFEIERKEEHEGCVEWIDREPFHWEKIKRKLQFEESLSIKSYGYYVIDYDRQTGQISDYGFEQKLKSKTEEAGREIRKLRNDINDRLKKLFNEKFERRMRS